MTAAAAEQTGWGASMLAKKINPDIQTQWFKDRLADRDKTQRALAQYLDMDFSAVSLLLNGRRRIQVKDAEKIARFLNEPVDEVLRRIGMRIPAMGGSAGKRGAAGRSAERRVPIAFNIDADGLLRPAGGRGATAAKTAPAPADADDETVAARMEAGFAPGGVVLFVPSKQVEVDAVGRLSIVWLDDGKAWLGVLTPGLDRGRFDLSLPRGNRTGVKAKAAAPILWIRP